MSLAGRSWQVYPFDLIDCSTTCGSPGWYELHSIYWDTNSTETCFGIFYLESNSPSAVPLDYSICLPNLGMTPPGQSSLGSSWMAH